MMHFRLREEVHSSAIPAYRSPLLLRLRRAFLVGLAWAWKRDYPYSSGEDTACEVSCACGERIDITDGFITWCQKCGRGYETTFSIRQYPARFRPDVATFDALIRQADARRDGYIKNEAARGMHPDSSGGYWFVKAITDDIANYKRLRDARARGQW